MLARQAQTLEFFENDKVRQKSLISFNFKSNIEVEM